MATLATSRNKDGSPRKLRKATNARAQHRQARKVKEFQLGRKLGAKEIVHHEGGMSNVKKTKVITYAQHNLHHKHAKKANRA
jgi:hypothetical protein